MTSWDPVGWAYPLTPWDAVGPTLDHHCSLHIADLSSSVWSCLLLLSLHILHLLLLFLLFFHHFLHLSILVVCNLDVGSRWHKVAVAAFALTRPINFLFSPIGLLSCLVLRSCQPQSSSPLSLKQLLKIGHTDSINSSAPSCTLRNNLGDD